MKLKTEVVPSVNKSLLFSQNAFHGIFYNLGTLPSTWQRVMNKTKSLPFWVLHSYKEEKKEWNTYYLVILLEALHILGQSNLKDT